MQKAQEGCYQVKALGGFKYTRDGMFVGAEAVTFALPRYRVSTLWKQWSPAAPSKKLCDDGNVLCAVIYSKPEAIELLKCDQCVLETEF